MSSPRTSAVVQRIYHTVHMALWALLAALVAVMIISIPRWPAALALAEWQRAQDISEESRFYCEKWGMRAGTREHASCTLDLQAIRAKVEQRMADDTQL
jgi:hypothetical protein